MLSTNISTNNLCRNHFNQLNGSNFEQKSSVNFSMMRTDLGNSSTTKCWQNILIHINNEQTSWQYKYSSEHIFVLFFLNMWQVLYMFLGMIFFWLLWWKWLLSLMLLLLFFLLFLVWLFFWLFVYLFVVAYIFIQYSLFLIILQTAKLCSFITQTKIMLHNYAFQNWK